MLQFGSGLLWAYLVSSETLENAQHHTVDGVTPNPHLRRRPRDSFDVFGFRTVHLSGFFELGDSIQQWSDDGVFDLFKA